jgi:uncharacterized OsmC-like protein
MKKAVNIKMVAIVIIALAVGCGAGFYISQQFFPMKVYDYGYDEAGNMITIRAENPPQITSFEPSPDIELSLTDMIAGKITTLDFEVVSVVERIPSAESEMLKKATVHCNIPGYDTWVLVCDEGNPMGYQQAPNPLNYFTAGAGLCLMTHISGAEHALGIELDDVRIEQRITYLQTDIMTDNATGDTKTVETNIIIESDESEEVLKQLRDIALSSCFAGEAFKNPTPIESKLFINGNEVN